jgi:pimeloyl-ACP methyl ester carboxylesterase
MLAGVAAGVAERIPGARLVTVPETAHFLPMERPDAVLAEITAFLDSVEAPR